MSIDNAVETSIAGLNCRASYAKVLLYKGSDLTSHNMFL